jgi:molecular chaperone GrpE
LHAQATFADSLLIDGLSLTLSQFRDTLASAGVTEIAAEVGEPFDPKSHEAVARVPNSGLAHGAISEVLQLGFRLHDRVLRPARVAVAA